MQLPDVLAQLRLNRDFMSQAVAWQKFPAQPARFQPVEAEIDERIMTALRSRGVTQFFTHQAQAIDGRVPPPPHRHRHRHRLRQIALLHRARRCNGCSTGPTPALSTSSRPKPWPMINWRKRPPPSRRQTAHRGAYLRRRHAPKPAHPGAARRRHPHHQSRHAACRHPALPSHLARPVCNLEFVVLDEIHTYRGVFGSHVANVLRRLQRICEFYGSTPQFICCSATIANPQEHAERLVGRPFTLVDEIAKRCAHW